MNIEYALVKTVVGTVWFHEAVKELYSPGNWMDHYTAFADTMMQRAGFIVLEHPEQPFSLLLYPVSTMRARPAFIAVYQGHASELDAFIRFFGATYTVEAVEDGLYGVAGKSKTPLIRTKTQDTALHA